MSAVASVESGHAHVALLELRRAPFNYLDVALLRELADRLAQLDADPECRVVVLAAEGRAFSAGADFSGKDDARDPAPLYEQAMRLFGNAKPLVAAVHGPAIGAGLGLALAADFRVGCAEARFSANFNRLGFHPGFGLSLTLPRLVGAQQAALLLYTGRRIDGAEALRIGLVDELAPQDQVRERAQALAGEIAISAPIAVESTRASLRAGLVEAVRAAVEREAGEQRQHFQTQDFREGVAAMAQRRDPVFGRH